MSLKAKHKGAANELAAVLWLLEQGYDVFRNVSSHGSIDLLAVRDGETLRLDVKSGPRAFDLRTTPTLTEQRELGVKILIPKNGGFEITELPICPSERVCGCGLTFMPRRSSQIHCTRGCEQRRKQYARRHPGAAKAAQ